MVTTARSRWLKASAVRKEDTKKQEAERVSKKKSSSSSSVDPSKPSSVVFTRENKTITKQTFQDGEVVSEEVVQDNNTPRSNTKTTSELAKEEQIMRRTEQLKPKGYFGSVEEKFYQGLTEEELLKQKLATGTKAKEVPTQTARIQEATEIRRKIKAGEPLTQKEQFRVLTGESATDISSLNRAIDKTSGQPTQYKERLEGIEKYNKEAEEYQESKSAESSQITSKIIYSKNEGKRIQEKWAERLVKKEAEVYTQHKEERFALGLSFLDKNPYDNPVVSTTKSVLDRGYAFTVGVITGSTGRSLLLAGEKALFYAYSGGLAISNKAARPAFIESTKEQTIAGANAITVINLKSLIEEGKIEYDPEGTANILTAGTMALFKTSSIMKQRTVTPKKGSYRSDKVETEITPSGRTVTEQGRFVNVRGDTIKTTTKYTLNEAGKGKYTQTLKDITGETVGTSKGGLSQNVKYNPDTKALEYQSVARRGLFRQKEAGKGEYESTRITEGNPESTTSVTKMTAQVKKSGRLNEEYGIEKVSRVDAKGTTKVTTEEGMLGQGGTVSPTKTVTSTFTPNKLTETTVSQKVNLDGSKNILDVSIKLLGSKKGSAGVSAGRSSDFQSFTGASTEINFAGTSPKPISPVKVVSPKTSSVPVKPLGNVQSASTSGGFSLGDVQSAPTSGGFSPTSPISPPVINKISQLTPITPTIPVGSSISLLTSQSPTLSLIPITPSLSKPVSELSGKTQEAITPKLNIRSISQEQEDIKSQNIARSITDPISNVPSKTGGISKPTEDVITKTDYQPSTELLSDFTGKSNTKNNILAPSISISPTVPIIIPPSIFFGGFGFPTFNGNKVQTQKGFKVITKQGGKEKLLSSVSFTKDEAIQFGASRIDKSARASFRLKETDRVTGEFKGKTNLNKFYKSKSGFFVEKSAYRINTAGEVREISKKGQIAKKLKKKKSIFTFGGK